MHCPFCRFPDSRVTDSRTSDDGSSIRRRRQCPECNMRFSTTETASLNVVKRSGVTESFSRGKIVNGVRKACQGRPVTESDLALLAQEVEEAIRATGSAQIEANDIGLAILGPLRKLDEVAFMRFASVYQGWETLEDFEAAIQVLKVERETDREEANAAENTPVDAPQGSENQ
jgi:transcriptional repressor NrdR